MSGDSSADIPPGWLEDYMRYASAPVVTSPDFHLLCGLVLLGAAIGKRAILQTGYDEEFPNLYAMLVGPSGASHKTASINLAVRLLQLAGLGNVLLPDRFYSVSVSDALAKNPDGLIVWDEVSQYFEHMSGIAGLGIRPLLTGIYGDNPAGFQEYSRTRGYVRVQDAAVSLVSGSTADWLRSHVDNGTFSGGFMARFQFALWEPPDFRERVAPNNQLKKELAETLTALRHSEKTGCYAFDKPAQRLFKGIEREVHQSMEQDVEDAYRAVLSRRLQVTAKLAILCKVSQDRRIEGFGIISESLLKLANKLALRFLETAKHVIEIELVPDKWERARLDLKAFIERNPGCTRSQMIHGPAATRDTLRLTRTLGTLLEGGDVVEKWEKGEKKVVKKYYVAEQEPNR